MTAEQLKELLRSVPNLVAPIVDVQGEPPHLLATITSGSFANMDEA